MVTDVNRERPVNSTEAEDGDVLPCLLRPGGCPSTLTLSHDEKKKPGSSGQRTELVKTQASIQKAVTQLQKDLDMRTAELVKEIERRAAEMRKEINNQAEDVIEAVKYLVTILADSVARADEMGEGFVREWFDEAEQKYVGLGSKGDQLDDEINQWNDDLKQSNERAHEDMVEDLKTSVEKTREKYGRPKISDDVSLDEQLGLSDETNDKETPSGADATAPSDQDQTTDAQTNPETVSTTPEDGDKDNKESTEEENVGADGDNTKEAIPGKGDFKTKDFTAEDSYGFVDLLLPMAR